MCYDVSYLTKKQADYEKRYGELADLASISSRLNVSNPGRFFHVNAFSHDPLPVIRMVGGVVDFFYWGLIPHWTRDEQQAVDLSRRTLNARGEELFEKPAYRKPAGTQRCLILLDGFFEHHHREGYPYPYFIQMADREPMTVAGLWDIWVDPGQGIRHQTVTIVTTAGNNLLAGIHNHPKLAGPRMPVILTRNNEKQWLADEPFEPGDVQRFLSPISSGQLMAYPVRPIRGKYSLGNCPEAQDPFDYPQLHKGLFDM